MPRESTPVLPWRRRMTRYDRKHRSSHPGDLHAWGGSRNRASSPHISLCPATLKKGLQRNSATTHKKKLQLLKIAKANQWRPTCLSLSLTKDYRGQKLGGWYESDIHIVDKAGNCEIGNDSILYMAFLLRWKRQISQPRQPCGQLE